MPKITTTEGNTVCIRTRKNKKIRIDPLNPQNPRSIAPGGYE
jgi:hypothetical protein